MARLTRKARDISGLVKTELPVAAGVCVVAGQLLALGGLPPLTEAVAGFLSVFFISGALMITNDYFDIEVDRVNHPERPLPSGRVSGAEALGLAALFTLCGLAAAAVLGLPTFLIAAFLWVIGILYNWKLKESGLPGNLIVATSVGMTFVTGGISVGQLSNGLVWLFGALAFFFDLAEELANGAMDVEGDKLRSARSLAIVRGKRFALGVSGLFYAVFIALTFVPYALGWLGLAYLALVVVTDLVVAYFVYRLLKSDTPREGKKMTRRLYLTLFVFVVAFIGVRLLSV
ncbi:MAG: Digeranylgeranylglyceryl phosphate synthase [Methanocella sp. PtaU1.Bin125]|nr:MAG: Digeranylgeranylglyceryl phosphate synthase [Methanocella sp. PtaU1.Bin125]